MRQKLLLLLACAFVLAVLAAGCTTGPQANATAVPSTGPAGTRAPASVAGNTTTLTAEGWTYPANVAMPAAAGFVVVAPEWQTDGQRAGDDEVEGVIQSTVAFLEDRSYIDPARLGLTGFCAGGRYTMLFLPQMHDFGAGIAWYGFPYGGPPNYTAPAELVADMESPMLMIHGSRDQASNYHGHHQLHAPARRGRPVLRAQGLPGQAPRVHDPERHPRPRRRGPGRLLADNHVLQADPGITPGGTTASRVEAVLADRPPERERRRKA